MEQSNNAKSKSLYVGGVEYQLIDEVKTEPLDDNQPSDVVKVSRKKIHVCDKCRKTLSSNQSLCRHKKICNGCSNVTESLDDDQPSDTHSLKHTSREPIPEKHTRKKRRDMYCEKCDKQFTSRSEYNVHFNELHHYLTARCVPCQRTFTRKGNLASHLKTKWHMQDDTCEFNDFIISKNFIWSPKIGEELTTLCDRNECYVDVVQEKQLIVGHVPQYLTNDFHVLLQSGGVINVKVIEKPIYTVFKGIKIPCTYYISGKLIFVENIRNKIS